MGAMSIWHWMIVLIVVLLLFGGGKITGVMSDLGKGIKSFKKEIASDDKDEAAPTAPQEPARLSTQGETTVASSSTESGATKS